VCPAGSPGNGQRLARIGAHWKPFGRYRRPSLTCEFPFSFFWRRGKGVYTKSHGAAFPMSWCAGRPARLTGHARKKAGEATPGGLPPRRSLSLRRQPPLRTEANARNRTIVVAAWPIMRRLQRMVDLKI